MPFPSVIFQLCKLYHFLALEFRTETTVIRVLPKEELDTGKGGDKKKETKGKEEEDLIINTSFSSGYTFKSIVQL